jgi:predicted nucleic acid-binding protein
VRFIVDASIAVEVLLQTAVGRAATELMVTADLFAPELIDAEILAVLRREAVAGRLKDKRAKEAVADLLAWDLVRIRHRELVPEAWALRHNATAYDAMYLAAARLHGATILTADGPLSRIPVAGFVIQNLATQ